MPEGTILVKDKRHPQNGTKRIREEDFDEDIHEEVPEPDEE